MQSDSQTIRQHINSLIRHWKASGALYIVGGGEVLYRGTFGQARRAPLKAMPKNPTFTFRCDSGLLLALCLMQLHEAGVLSPDDALSRFIPEYQHAQSIRLRHLAVRRSGIFDPYAGKLLPQLLKQADYQALDEHQKAVAEKTLYCQRGSFAQSFDLSKGKPLITAPGNVHSWPSDYDLTVLGEALRRAAGTSLLAYQQQHIFAPLGITAHAGIAASTASYINYHDQALLEYTPSSASFETVTLSFSDCIKLMDGLRSRALLRAASWRQLLRHDAQGYGLAGVNSSGFDCFGMQLLGWQLRAAIDPISGMYLLYVSNQEAMEIWQDGRFRTFLGQVRYALEGYFTYPVRPRMVTLSQDNLWDTMYLAIEPAQRNFVLNAVSSLAAMQVFKKERAFVLSEHGRVIGLLILEADRARHSYEINIVQIDLRFQGRGFDKYMLRWAVAYMEKAGAEELSIFVNRLNAPAIALYQSVGFTIHSVYSHAMELSMKFAPRP